MQRRPRFNAFRRLHVLASFTLAAMVPTMSLSADQQASFEIPGVEHVMTVRATIESMESMGKTPQGERRVVPITGGTFEGPGMKGTIMPGGEDWQLVREDGVMELDARYWLKTDDGAIVRVHNQVLVSAQPAASTKRYMRSSVRFEAPIGKYDWLNKAVFVGTIVPDQTQRPPIVTLRFFKVI